MLGVKNYSAEYIDACRKKVDADIMAYRSAVKAVGSTADVDAFETVFFNNMVIVLDALFMHRLRTVEGKDGNPMNEVRVLSSSLIEAGGTMTADKTIKMPPEKSVLKIAYGEPIEVTETGFAALSAAYFGDIERKFL